MLHNPNWKQPTEVELDEIGQHLLRAADYIEEHGWCQCTSENSKGNVCILGALDKTKNPAESILPPYCIVATLILETPSTWNDKLGRTKDEVVAILRKAAYSK